MLSIKEELICEQEAESQVLQIAEAAIDGIDMDGLMSMTIGQMPQQIAGTEEERAIYTFIEESQNRGIWIKELREGTGLNQLQLRKTLKSLETKKLIKTIKAVGSTKKCYILFDVEPDMALTGGTFYSDQQLDSELINTLISVSGSYAASRRKLALEEFPNNIQMQKIFSYIRPQEEVRANRALPPAALYEFIRESRIEVNRAHRALNLVLRNFIVNGNGLPQLREGHMDSLDITLDESWRGLNQDGITLQRALVQVGRNVGRQNDRSDVI